MAEGKLGYAKRNIANAYGSDIDLARMKHNVLVLDVLRDKKEKNGLAPHGLSYYTNKTVFLPVVKSINGLMRLAEANIGVTFSMNADAEVYGDIIAGSHIEVSKNICVELATLKDLENVDAKDQDVHLVNVNVHLDITNIAGFEGKPEFEVKGRIKYLYSYVSRPGSSIGTLFSVEDELEVITSKQFSHIAITNSVDFDYQKYFRRHSTNIVKIHSL